MNRFIPAVPVALLVSLCSLAASADEPSGKAATATQATSAAPTQGAQPATATPSTSAGQASVQRLVCLNMSLQCFAMKPKTDDASAKTRTASLDLKAPDIRLVVPEVELRMPLQDPEVVEQQVQVEGSRPEVYVPGGIASLPWAVMHPTQAWRIFLPVPPGVAK